MKKDFLTGLGVAEDIADKIMTEHSKGIESAKAKFGDYDTLKTQLSEANSKIEEFGKLDYDGVKKMADDYKIKFEKAQTDSVKQLEDLRFNHTLDNSLTSAKAKNIKALKALLDADKLKLDKDGNITGLDEQLSKIKSEASYLFDAEDTAPKFLGGASGSSGGASDDNTVRAIMGLPANK